MRSLLRIFRINTNTFTGPLVFRIFHTSTSYLRIVQRTETLAACILGRDRMVKHARVSSDRGGEVGAGDGAACEHSCHSLLRHHTRGWIMSFIKEARGLKEPCPPFLVPNQAGKLRVSSNRKYILRIREDHIRYRLCFKLIKKISKQLNTKPNVRNLFSFICKITNICHMRNILIWHLYQYSIDMHSHHTDD